MGQNDRVVDDDPPAGGPAADAGPTYSVVVVDDDFMVARIHTRYLGGRPGFEVVATVHTGAEALAAVATLRPDLLLLDVYLPDMSGIDVLRRVRAEFPQVDIIVVSAARELDTVRAAVQGGAVSYLIKPFEYDALGERLEHFRQTRRLLDEAARVDLQIEQQHVDRLFGVTPAGGAAEQPVPKGLSPETVGAVRSLLTRDEALSASQVAERIGLSRVSARRYLEYLERTGAVVVSLKYGAGRPERLFRLR
ncbi:response regulator [Nakamurella flava]|uniref:Transcriptional regulatory protein n=1 Tax=Nakamurella flava TaxID=2576308 RepID=A0A4U6QBK8_9ACTN|nr:response regulator [Nakamurella flava]TKV57289.1 response regulator [Nakamurella flava]